MCHLTVYNAKKILGARITYSHGWLRGLSSILKKVFFGTPYFTAEDALKSKSRRKQLELNFTLKYKCAGHNFDVEYLTKCTCTSFFFFFTGGGYRLGPLWGCGPPGGKDRVQYVLCFGILCFCIG